jgi:hypothetical protein
MRWNAYANCLFCHVSHQLYKTESRHAQIRTLAIQHLINKLRREWYGIVYLVKTLCTGEDWGPAGKPTFMTTPPFRFWTVNTITWLVNTKTVENRSICWFQYCCLSTVLSNLEHCGYFFLFSSDTKDDLTGQSSGNSTGYCKQL